MLTTKNNIDWEVEKGFISDHNGKRIPDYRILYRSDNDMMLNICKKSYQPLYNSEFIETVERMATITNMDLTGYSEIDHGKKVISYINTGETNIAGYVYRKYMVIGNSHDYSTGFFIASANEMLRCQNQFGKLYKGRDFSIPHTKSIRAGIDILMRRFENWAKEQETLEDNLKKWANVSVDKEIREALVNRLIAIESGDEESISSRKRNQLNNLNVSLDREMGALGDNLLGLFQGVTHYTTHAYRQKEAVYGNIFGSTSRMNNQAFDFAKSVELGNVVNEFDLLGL